ncbi:MAG: T9SS type A sorting domain-containing protein, partial [Ignavibacteria bacterium]|nr:T9SS type A sorting domain-containing protein [Ignavibacteria bacterium]
FIGQYTTYNGTSWTPLVSLPLIGGPSGNFSVAAGSNGITGIFGTNYINDGYLYWYKSTDNGINFDNGSLIFNYNVNGADTIFANLTGGFQAVFLNNEPHIVFTAYNIRSTVFPDPNTLEYVTPKLLHWSPATGVTEVAGKFNIPALTDTITTALLAPVGQPTLSVTPEGNLVCSFTAFLRGNTQTVDDGSVLNAGEIMYTVSVNNGASWRTPVNITNTPNIEEKHSSVTEKLSSDTMKITYLRDMKAGGWVNVASWGKAPVYEIFRKTYTGTIGINQISSEVTTFGLSQNYPNPFNPSTVIKFSIPKSEFTTLKVYDNNGREVAELVNGKLNSGTYETEFSSDIYKLSSGVYYYKLISGTYSETKKMMLVK